MSVTYSPSRLDVSNFRHDGLMYTIFICRLFHNLKGRIFFPNFHTHFDSWRTNNFESDSSLYRLVDADQVKLEIVSFWQMYEKQSTNDAIFPGNILKHSDDSASAINDSSPRRRFPNGSLKHNVASCRLSLIEFIQECWLKSKLYSFFTGLFQHPTVVACSVSSIK